MNQGQKNNRGRRWGRVWARPSEYLIKLRRGKVVAHGVGLSVRLWPWDTCAILPTSIQRTSFVADQVTSEKVGVAVTGIAVYRIADPLLAFRMLDFDPGPTPPGSGAASGLGPGGAEHLSAILKEMFIGAARRLVANMTVEQCMTQRKESIAAELMREIQPVVSGSGRPEDRTDRGWGVVIDTIEIQDVRILSEKVFADLQAPYRATLELQARTSAVKRDQQIHLREVDAQRALLEADQELLHQKSAAEEQSRRQALERKERLKLAETLAEQNMARAVLDSDLAARARQRTLSDAEHALAAHRVDQETELARSRVCSEAELASQQARLGAELEELQLRSRTALEEEEAKGAVRVAEKRVQAERLQAELRLWLEQKRREVENLFSDERLRHDFITTAMPALCEAFVSGLGEVHLTRFVSGADEGGGGNLLAETMAQLLEVARASGLDLGRILGRGPA